MIKVVRVWPRAINKGSLIGFINVDLSLDGSDNKQMEFRNLRLMQSERGPWIAFPSERYEKDGETKWNDFIRIPYSDDDKNEVGQEFKNKILDAAVKAFKALGNKNSAYQEQPSSNRNSIGNDDLPF